MRRIIVLVVVDVVLLISIVRIIVAGVTGLTLTPSDFTSSGYEAGDICEFRVSVAAEAFQSEPNRLGFSRHYYLVLLEESFKPAPLLVEAKTSWFDENFSEIGYTRDPVTVKGQIYKFSLSADAEGEINSLSGKFSDPETNISTEYFVKTSYRGKYIICFAVAAVGLSAVAVYTVSVIRRDKMSTVGIVMTRIYLFVGLLITYGMVAMVSLI